MQEKIDEKLRKCFDEGKKGSERHKGLVKVSIDIEKSEAYLAKALHNFNAITDFHNLGYSDWSASASFYSLYVGLLAILAKRGYESRNQSCTFALLEDLINKGEIKTLTSNDIREIFDKDITTDLAHSAKILDIREKMQYSTRTSLEELEFQSLKDKTKELLDKIRLEFERE